MKEANGTGALLNVGYAGLALPPAAGSAQPPVFPGLETALPAGRRKRAGQRLRVCIVTREFFGPFKNGGIGTAYTHLAHFLAQLGHEVTVYFVTQSRADSEESARWVAYYARFGITFIVGDAADPPSSGSPNSRAMSFSRQVYEWLKPREFDVVHVSEYRGDGYVSLQAKKLGLAFPNTTFVVKTSSPTLWCNLGNDSALTDVNNTITMYIERKSVELADYVISPSQHMLRWMTEFGYELPDRVFVQPNLIVPDKEAPLGAFPARSGVGGNKRAVKEIVFFGRLEWRKGLVIFCRALKTLQRRGDLDAVKVTLMGKGTKETLAYVAGESEGWLFKWQIIDDYDSQQAIEYLRGEDRVACIPSLAENSASPSTRACCTTSRSWLATPVATPNSCTPETVRPSSSRKKSSALVRSLAEVIHNGITVARPSFSFTRSRKTWKDFHEHLAADLARGRRGVPRGLAAANGDQPTVTICMAHYNRPVELGQAIDSIRALTYQHIELIITDDGSSDPEALEYLESLKPEFAGRGWSILYQENRYLGAARNNSARHASGRYLLFMDDDNLAKPEELDVFVSVALRTDADILTCFADNFSGSDPRAPGARIERETRGGRLPSQRNRQERLRRRQCPHQARGLRGTRRLHRGFRHRHPGLRALLEGGPEGVLARACARGAVLVSQRSRAHELELRHDGARPPARVSGSLRCGAPSSAPDPSSRTGIDDGADATAHQVQPPAPADAPHSARLCAAAEPRRQSCSAACRPAIAPLEPWKAAQPSGEPLTLSVAETLPGEDRDAAAQVGRVRLARPA